MPDEETTRREQLTRELQVRDRALLGERVERYLSIDHHGIVAGTVFAGASAECIELFRDGHFYGAISLAQAVGEALARHMCHSNKWRPAKDFEENVKLLRTRGFLDDETQALFLDLYQERNDYHHLNPKIETDRRRLDGLARAKVRTLQRIEAFVFAWSLPFSPPARPRPGKAAECPSQAA